MTSSVATASFHRQELLLAGLRDRSASILWASSLLLVVTCHVTAAWWLIARSEDQPVLSQPLPAITIDLAPASTPAPVAKSPPPTSPPPPQYQPALHPPAPQVLTPEISPPLPDTPSDATLPQQAKKPAEQQVKPKPVKKAPTKPIPVKPVTQPAPVQAFASARPKTPPAPIAPANVAASKQEEVAVAAAIVAAKSNWLGDVVQHIAKFKRVPRGRLRQPLRVILSFDIDRAGKLQSVHLLQRSGRDDIDEEARAWITRADPLPKPPAEVSDGDLSNGFTIPFDFMPR
jgi:protein TonB